MFSLRSISVYSFLTAVCLAAPLCATADPTRLSMTFSGTEVVVSGVTPKHQAVLVGLANEPMGYYANLVTFHELLEDTDGDGIVHFDTKSRVAWKSIWGAVDLQTGDFMVAHPERSRGRQIDFKGQGLGRDANGKFNKLEHAGQWLDVLLVKPTGDVFRTVVVDGGPLDEDGKSDNVIHASLSSMELARGQGEKPDEYRQNDVLFVIDPDELTMVAVKVK